MAATPCFGVSSFGMTKRVCIICIRLYPQKMSKEQEITRALAEWDLKDVESERRVFEMESQSTGANGVCW